MQRLNYITAKRMVYLKKLKLKILRAQVFFFLCNGVTGFITLLCSAIWQLGVKTPLLLVSVCKQKLANNHA